MADPNEFERKDFEHKGDDRGLLPPAAGAEPTAEATAKTNAKIPGDLPEVDSPSISPAVSEPVAIEEEKIEPKAEPEVETARREALNALVLVPRNFSEAPPFEPLEVEEPRPRAFLKPRHWRAMRLAAAVTLAAGFGAIAGTYAIGRFNDAPKVDVAAQEEKKVMQQSMAKMAKELTTLKASLEASTKTTQTQTASLEKRISDKINERINERLKKDQADVTGSISPPQTMPAAPSAIFADVPTPKPAPRAAMAQSQAPRLPVVSDWSVRGARNGYVYVEGRYGDIYQVVPGAPLPGLGPVESIRRLDGRWVVTTPKGIIVSMQDRRSF
ncbi:OmpH family outer membrane protein [Undibacter mobilis]|uniref:OmpH family outer membrane protein n=1 Tax=Undibacter mobilis TaxID=2292256 RepID=A0A371B8N7_9BRAD|nr:OmpH family outer membrane protein [Undibacter mobilis]RDV03930.1 OmpH family outer membrane protein [Undibacter mobilis]